MAKFIGEVKVEAFLKKIVEQFNFGEVEKDGFLYKFELNDSLCQVGYTKHQKLLSRNYDLTFIIEKEVEANFAGDHEVEYYFHKKRWGAKKNNPLVQVANDQFSLDWSQVDFGSLKIRAVDKKRIFEMTILPGSYSTLLFPPMAQGISIFQEEIKVIQSMVEIISTKLNYSA